MRAMAVTMLLTLAGCGEEPTVSPPPSTVAISERDHLRDEAHVVLERWCGQCHISGYDTALPRALAVFDLADVEWSAHMSTMQLEDARTRVRERRGPEGDIPITDEDVAIIERYVAAEIDRRAISD
jgi:hypothetical protein